jgi:rRNA maturation protein Rpf1
MLFTTSRRTSQRTRTFCRELASVFPLSDYVVRGKKSVRELCSQASHDGHERVIIVESRNGNPSSLLVLDPTCPLEWQHELPISVKTRKDMGLKVHVRTYPEDVPVVVRGDTGLEPTVAEVFGASTDAESDVAIEVSTDDASYWLQFYRHDVSADAVGPAIRVKRNEDDNRTS